jgi:hypothetical protein
MENGTKSIAGEAKRLGNELDDIPTRDTDVRPKSSKAKSSTYNPDRVKSSIDNKSSMSKVKSAFKPNQHMNNAKTGGAATMPS